MAKKESNLPTGVYLKRGSLWVRYGHEGKHHHRAANTTSVPEALKVRAGLIADVHKGDKLHAGTGNITCGVLLTNYLERLEKTSKSDSDTYKITKGTVTKHVLPYFGTLKVERVDRKMLERYQAKKLLENGQVSINRQLGYLRTAFKQGKRDKLTNNEPDFSTSIIRSAEEENVRTGIVTEAQYVKLVAALESQPHIQTLFVLAWNTGVRPSEAFRLKWDQVNWQNRLISVFKSQAKIGKPRYLPLREQAYQQLLKWRDYLNDHVKRPVYIFTHPATGARLTKSDYRAPWLSACRTNGWTHVEIQNGKNVTKTDLLFYDARRAFRTYLPSEINATDGMSVMGHNQDSTFDRYLGAAQAAQRVRKALDGDNDKPEPTPAPTITTKPSGYDKLAAIKDLIAMRNAGDITAEEFAEMKSAL